MLIMLASPNTFLGNTIFSNYLPDGCGDGFGKNGWV